MTPDFSDVKIMHKFPEVIARMAVKIGHSKSAIFVLFGAIILKTFDTTTKVPIVHQYATAYTLSISMPVSMTLSDLEQSQRTQNAPTNM